MFEGVLDVKTSVGYDRLGGKDVDQILMDFFGRKFREQRGFDIATTDKRAAQVLKQFAEEYKKQLSFIRSGAD
jgi:molecular chaperone DnaK (HSP70)